MPWFFLCFHLSNDVIHPKNEVTDHAEEFEQIMSISQCGSPGVDQEVQILPSVDHLSLTVFDLCLLVTSIACL
jgi:hypothetical protein